MKIRSKGFWCLSAIALLIIVSLSILFIFREEKATAEDIQQCLQSNPESSAQVLAKRLFPQPARQEKFAQELIHLYNDCEGVDFLLIYNTGGFAWHAEMEKDPEWRSVLNGVEEELAKMGYTCLIHEHERAGPSVPDFLTELRGMEDYYATKAQILATKVAFLTQYRPNLSVIITGRSNGAILCNEAMKLLEDNPQAYSIQAGEAWWYLDDYQPPQALLIMDNGEMPDSLSQRDIYTIIQANLWQFPSTSPDENGSIQFFKWYIKTPGHVYTWEHQGVNERVTNFLQENFSAK